MRRQVILECVESDITYCVWFGPITNPMPVFAKGTPVARAEFDAAMSRAAQGLTTYIVRTVKLALTMDDDHNPADRYSESIIAPRGRIYRVWLRSPTWPLAFSLIVEVDRPDEVVPITAKWLLDHDRGSARIQKVTELPLYFDYEKGKEECGDLDYRQPVRLPCGARMQGEPPTAGEFMIHRYASFFDDRRTDEDNQDSQRSPNRR
jgi:hypothetical protein